MKKLLWLALLAFTVNIASAQKDSAKVFKPEEGQFGVFFNVSGLLNNINISPTKDPIGNDLILAKYRLKNNHFVRMGLGMRSYNNTSSMVDSLGSAKVTTDSTFKKFNFFISPAYEYHFQGLKRLDPYIGAGINLGLLGKTKIETEVLQSDTTGEDKRQTSYEKAGGFMFGFNALIGFNYFIAQRVALGVEYNIGFYNVRDGGDWERVTVNTPVSGNPTSVREVGSDRTVQRGFDHSNNLSFTLSYYFGQSKSKTASP
ncbi:outer membrane beta-barrel protein [bacterium SCSIO 12741]|nr:outer membrane beta-barrel protein [bacterium SCSIO 12741]